MTTRHDVAKRYAVSRQTINEWRGLGAPVDNPNEMDGWVHKHRPDRYPWQHYLNATEALWLAAEELVGVVPDDELAEELLQAAWCCLIRRPGVPRIDLDDLRQLLASAPPAPIEAAPDSAAH